MEYAEVSKSGQEAFFQSLVRPKIHLGQEAHHEITLPIYQQKQGAC